MSVICRAPVAPIHADASLRAEQVTQLVLGETGTVLERRDRVAARAHRHRLV